MTRGHWMLLAVLLLLLSGSVLAYPPLPFVGPHFTRGLVAPFADLAGEPPSRPPEGRSVSIRTEALASGSLTRGASAGPARAQPEGGPEEAELGPPLDDRSLAGRIATVKLGQLTLVGDREPLYLDHSSVILQFGAVAEASVLHPGAAIHASFDLRGGHRVARTLSLVTEQPRWPR